MDTGLINIILDWNRIHESSLSTGTGSCFKIRQWGIYDSFGRMLKTYNLAGSDLKRLCKMDSVLENEECIFVLVSSHIIKSAKSLRLCVILKWYNEEKKGLICDLRRQFIYVLCLFLNFQDDGESQQEIPSQNIFIHTIYQRISS